MKLKRKTFWIIFGIVAVIVTLITMMVIDGTSPLYVGLLGHSLFDKIWMWFVYPALMVLFIPAIFIFELFACGPTTSCPGLIDGGPADKYFFTFFSILIGVLYGFVVAFVVKLVKSRRRGGSNKSE